MDGGVLPSCREHVKALRLERSAPRDRNRPTILRSRSNQCTLSHTSVADTRITMCRLSHQVDDVRSTALLPSEPCLILVRGGERRLLLS